jgi:hypothetical protein
MTRAQITQLINTVGDLLTVLRTAEPTDKAAVYQQLGIRIVYKPNAHTVQVESQPNLQDMGISSCPRGVSTQNPIRQVGELLLP